jgi:plastocyanin
MNTAIKLLAMLAIIVALAPAAAAQSYSDVWDLSQGSAITYTTAINGGSDARDIFGGTNSAQETGFTIFQDNQPTNVAHAIEWQTPNFMQITNFNLFLSSDSSGTPGMRAISSFKLYASDGTGFQLIFSSNSIPLYVGAKTLSGSPTIKSANKWRAEFTPIALGSYNGIRVGELDGFGTVVPPLNVPSDGSDGVLNITSNTVIDLSQAVTGTWTNNNTANSGKGVYDSSKWAVVFKYQSVNIAVGSTVTFSNHASHAPVVWLVQSNAMINGIVNLDGHFFLTTYPNRLTPNEPGPGGFRGGAIGPLGQGGGFGPGGANTIGNDYYYGAGYGNGYGNPQVMPLMGGSGAGGFSSSDYYGPFAGPSGGGAILIVAGNTMMINGQITANGSGNKYWLYGGVYSGGGAIRVIANSIQGNGTISAAVNRAEANATSSQLIFTPNTVAVPPGTTPVIWPSVTTPTVKVVSVNGLSSPADPLAAVLTSSDLSLGTNGPMDIFLVTSNFPPSGVVSLRVIPKYANVFGVNASFVSGTFSSATWKATATLPNGFCVLQAHATSP